MLVDVNEVDYKADCRVNLDHYKITVTDFDAQYGGNWGRLKRHICLFGASGDDWDEDVWEEGLEMTAFVYLAFNDPMVEETEIGALSWCANLWSVSFSHILRVREETFEKCSNLQYARFDKANRIAAGALIDCFNLRSVWAPCCTYVGQAAFLSCYELRDVVTFQPNVVTMDHAYSGCVALEVIAAAAGYTTEEWPTDGEIFEDRPDPTSAIKCYIWGRKTMDDNKKLFKSLMVLLELCNREVKGDKRITPRKPRSRSRLGSITSSFRSMWPTRDKSRREDAVEVTPNDHREKAERNWRAIATCPVMKFLSGRGRDLSRLVLSFLTGDKVGEGDVRWASKEELMALGIKYRVFDDDHPDDEKIKKDLMGSKTTRLSVTDSRK
ncbi:hypothetical protein TrRE_jg13498 [Triparma retinervis]|uniref:Uncharacterized protein n=1 Tax=Triparma retinervis TaxID=2557542 RepID=A0A9W7A0X4_9STRA|nr:hypothetical protein TrRE_jg13498 [Triparma retinervis]